MTPLPAIDRQQVDAFWRRAVASGAVGPATPVPTAVDPFGDSRELADELIALVVDGPKRATAGAVADFEHEGVPLPSPGGLTIATDGHGRPRAVLRTTEVRVGPLSSVDDAFAWDEGEGDRSRRSWLEDHERYLRRYLPTIGVEFDPHMPVVFERFEVVYRESPIVTHSVTATPDPPPVGVPNPIHAADGASSAGYAGALVAGVRTYGWVAEAVIDALGPTWLEDGWADVTLRRPLFAGEDVTITVGASAAATGGRSVCAAVGDRVVLAGSVGLGRAAWLDDIDPPAPAPALDPPDPRPTYTTATAPLGVPLRPLGAYVSDAAARHIKLDELGQDRSRVPDGQLHPWFLAGRMAPLTRHNFTYGPTIHVRTQIQHRGVARSEQEVVVGARLVEVYDRKGHWYQVLDGLVVGDGGVPECVELARIRHHTIFRPRGTDMPEPTSGGSPAAP